MEGKVLTPCRKKAQKTAESGNCWPGVCYSHCLGAVNSAIDILLYTGTILAR